MNTYLIIAAILSLLTCLTHVVAGGPVTAKPLLKSQDIHQVAKYTNYYCWHIVSIILLAMPIGFTVSAINAESIELAMMMTALAGSFMLWNIVLVIWKRQNPWHMPQWALFLPITLFGVLGLWP